MPRVTLEGDLPALGVFGRGSLEVSVERRLDVNHQGSALRQMNDHVRANRSLIAIDLGLLREIAVFDHAGQFHDPPQREFSPLATHLGPAQGIDQILRLFV